MEGLRLIGMCIRLSSCECQARTVLQPVAGISQLCVRRLHYKAVQLEGEG